jgi:hypothetical protein
VIILPSISIPVSLIARSVYPNDILFFFVIFYYILILFIVSFVYGIYPIPFTAGKYFRKIGYEKTVIEFEFIKKVLFVGYPMLFSIEIFIYYFYYTFPSYDFLLALQAFNISLFFGGVVRIIAKLQKYNLEYILQKDVVKS